MELFPNYKCVPKSERIIWDWNSVLSPLPGEWGSYKTHTVTYPKYANAARRAASGRWSKPWQIFESFLSSQISGLTFSSWCQAFIPPDSRTSFICSRFVEIGGIKYAHGSGVLQKLRGAKGEEVVVGFDEAVRFGWETWADGLHQCHHIVSDWWWLKRLQRSQNTQHQLLSEPKTN